MKIAITVSFCFLISFFSFAQQTIIQYLSGTDKDHPLQLLPGEKDGWICI